METTIELLKAKVLQGGIINSADVEELIKIKNKELLWQAAAEITKALCPREFDSCSIVNAKSGRCPENCKWCAQSAHYDTGCDIYEFIDEEQCMAEAQYNHSKGIKRFSFVTSGKRLKGEELTRMCRLIKRVNSEVGISTCASMGLLNEDDFKELKAAGVNRYHCNLETAPSYFPHLCTTHTIDDKIRSIKTAQKLGFEICSGGIIGMGESEMQRYELAFKLREINPVSIPINILCPIKGTPLENTPPLSDEEILTTVAIFRFIHPKAQLRFAGGRNNLSQEMQLKAMMIGVNGAIMGDMLTTVGSKIDDDHKLSKQAGYEC